MQIVQSLILIDAVCLLTCWPGLLQNFIYALPSCQLNGKGCLDVLRYICSRDLMVAEVCSISQAHHKPCLDLQLPVQSLLTFTTHYTSWST